jgi:hypothetical protein
VVVDISGREPKAFMTRAWLAVRHARIDFHRDPTSNYGNGGVLTDAAM